MSNLRVEIKKSLINKFFFIPCIIGIIIMMIHVYFVVCEYNDFCNVMKELKNNNHMNQNPLIPLYSAFTMWICGDDNLFSMILFHAFPLMVTIPYGWRYCSEIKSGYNKEIVGQTGSFNYCISKFIATFISSGLVITIPLIVNFLSILMFIPSLTPDSVYDIYYGVFSNSFLGNVFYSNTFLYVAVFILINFLFCGLIGCLSYTFAALFRSRILSIIFPSMILLAINYFKQYEISSEMEISPITFLTSMRSLYDNWIVVWMEVIVLFLFTFTIGVVREKNKIASCINENEVI